MRWRGSAPSQTPKLCGPRCRWIFGGLKPPALGQVLILLAKLPVSHSVSHFFPIGLI
jgi:hypothetical protein